LPTAAAADEPVDLRGAYVLDRAGVLGGEIDEVEAAIADLADRADADLFIVLVDTFENPSDAGAWADETAIRNGLGSSDVLFAVAVDDRAYRWSVDEGFELSDDDLAAIARDRFESHLGPGGDDWTAALVGLADGLGDRLTGEGGFPVLPVLGGVAVLGVGGVVVARVVRRRRAASAAEADQRELD